MSCAKIPNGYIKIRNINEMLEKSVKKKVDKKKLSLTPQNISPRTRLRVKQEREAAARSEHPKPESGEATKDIKIHDKEYNNLNGTLIDVGKENCMEQNQTPLNIQIKDRKMSKRSNDSSSSIEFVLETPAPKSKTASKKTVKKTTTTKKGTLPPSQRFIDTFFSSSTKPKEIISTEKKQPRRGRKRLFADECNNKKKAKTTNQHKVEKEPHEVIDLCLHSDTEEEQADLKDFDLAKSKSMIKMTKTPDITSLKLLQKKSVLKKSETKENTEITRIKKGKRQKNELKKEGASLDNISSSSDNFVEKPPKPCPPYKVIDNTTFAVDAFRYGRIVGVTHYFLTHFHADHYTGLSRKFAMPVFMSSLTARLVREFIGLDDRLIFELPINEPVFVENVEITALDANHCPGAIIIVFKLANGKCILHTGDFRACHSMESEPIFWNNDIDTIYLDTTYLPTQYAFCTQHESIDRGKFIVQEFKKKHPHKRVLYVCGSYVIGKEKFWSSIAQEFNFKVWTEANRRKALKTMQLPELESIQYVEDAEDSDLHILPLGKLSYPQLYEYFQNFSKYYDVMLALRPSGWEKNSRPRFSAQINVVGIEYSEHSSYKELERFVKFLKPRVVISTVPVGHNLFETAEIPTRWYQYKDLHPQTRNHQPSITNYMKIIKPNAVSFDQNKLANTQFVEKNTHDYFHKISPSKSTPLACVGSITAPPDFDADALDDWLH